MDQASRDGKQSQIHKPDQSLAGHLISTKQVDRYLSSKVLEAAAVKTNPGTLTNPKPYHQPAQDGQIISNKQVNKSQVWDCGSSLYDSFELNSFNRQLDSAIKASSRTLSMPHLPERRAPPPIPEPMLPVITTITKHQTLPKKASKLSKSFKRIMKSVFRSSTNIKNGTNTPFIKATATEKQNDSFFLYNGSKSVRVLSTIPEMHESSEQLGKVDPQGVATPVVRRTASERFTAALVGVSCTQDIKTR